MRVIPPVIFALLLLAYASAAFAQKPIKARTESGKEVILSPDGTWKYVDDSSDSHAPQPVGAMTKPAAAKSEFKAKHGGFSIWYDESKWAQAKTDEEGRIEFRLKRGDAYAVAIIEELGVPTETLKEIALDNAKKAAPDAKVVFEENRTVNGTDLVCMKIEGTVKGIPFRYYGYYYGGKSGSIQLLTFTGTQIFPKYEQDFLEFLNGLVISEPNPDAGN